MNSKESGGESLKIKSWGGRRLITGHNYQTKGPRRRTVLFRVFCLNFRRISRESILFPSSTLFKVSFLLILFQFWLLEIPERRETKWWISYWNSTSSWYLVDNETVILKLAPASDSIRVQVLHTIQKNFLNTEIIFTCFFYWILT